MGDLVGRILKDIVEHFLVYFFLGLGLIFGLLLRQGVVGLALFCLAIGILIGQETPKT